MTEEKTDMNINRTNKDNYKKKTKTEQHFYNEDKKTRKYPRRLGYIMNT